MMVSPLNASEFPFLRDYVYLDSAKLGPLPSRALRAHERFYRDQPLGYDIGPGQPGHGPVWQDSVRGMIAGVVGASYADEIIFTEHTTEAINIVAQGLRFEEGDEIIITDVEHSSNVAPWLTAAERANARVLVARSDRDQIVDPTEIERMITPRTKLIAPTYMSNVFGSVQRVQEIASVAREHGILVGFDAAQAGGRWPVVVSEFDFVSFCGRKAFLGPYGTAFLYMSREFQLRVAPMMHGSFATIIDRSYALRDATRPKLYEAGGLNIGGLVGLEQSIALLSEIGIPVIQRAIRDLSSLLLDGLEELPVKVLACRDLDHQGGIVSWVPTNDQLTPDFVAEALRREGIISYSGTFSSDSALARASVSEALRFSLHGFNTVEDVDRALEATRSVLTR